MDEDNRKWEALLGLSYLAKVASGEKHPATLRYVLLCSVSLNVLVWVLVFFFSPEIHGLMFAGLETASDPEYVDSSEGGLEIVALMVGLGVVLPFGLGFVIAFCILSLMSPEIEASRKMDSGVMSGYGYISNEKRVTRLYMIAGAAGAINLFAILVIFHELR